MCVVSTISIYQLIYIHDDGYSVILIVNYFFQYTVVSLLPIGSMYAIYGNIYHQYTPNVSIYTSTMDPMGYNSNMPLIFEHQSSFMGLLRG